MSTTRIALNKLNAPASKEESIDVSRFNFDPISETATTSTYNIAQLMGEKEQASNAALSFTVDKTEIHEPGNIFMHAFAHLWETGAFKVDDDSENENKETAKETKSFS